MDSRAVVLQGISYPICVVLAKQKAPSGFEPVSTSTPDSAYKYVAELGTALSGDASKRLDLIQLLQAAGIHCPRQASARETAAALVSALTSGAVSCYRQKAKTVIQVSDNTRSSQAKKSQSKSSSSSGKKATPNIAPATRPGPRRSSLRTRTRTGPCISSGCTAGSDLAR